MINFNDKKTRNIFSTIIIISLVIALVVPGVLSTLGSMAMF